ncbi:Phosphatidic acid phosphatase type 2/haloperoxidase [Dillenia turbinata]|uniref:Phosphatidic acid phosphatase type 2/haloperoxidase n=1 Tax=Dillenia turbinata TaxID=194707 RepID=A0AAN8VNX7_9MAGN
MSQTPESQFLLTTTMETDLPPSPTTVTTKPPPTILNRLINLDTNWSLHLHTIFQPFPRAILKALELSGDGRFWFPIPIALFLSPISPLSPLRHIVIGLFLGSLLDLLLVGLIKFLVRRPRPVYNKDMNLTVAVDHWSFPSGHSSRVCFISSFISLSIEKVREGFVDLDSDGKVLKYVVSAVFMWSIFTSISRVLLGRHFVFDVVAGAFLGVIEAIFVFYFMKYYWVVKNEL